MNYTTLKVQADDCVILHLDEPLSDDVAKSLNEQFAHKLPNNPLLLQWDALKPLDDKLLLRIGRLELRWKR